MIKRKETAKSFGEYICCFHHPYVLRNSENPAEFYKKRFSNKQF